MTVIVPLRGFRLVEIRHGDTLQVIAARELGDASKWALLATINDLMPPYLTGYASEASASVKLYGQLLLVPAATAQVSAETDPELVFGVDLDLTGGTLKAADSGDLALIAGRANLRQAIVHRINTDLGELLFHQKYGCGVRTLIGTGNGPTAGLLAAEYVKGAMRQDKRVETVNYTNASIMGDLLKVDAQVKPISGAPVDLSVSF